jgi:hypothetical protein
MLERLDRGVVAETTGRAARDRAPAASAPGVNERTGQVMRDVWRELLAPGREIDPDETFFALGGDSLAAVALINRLNARLSTNLRVQDLLDAPTIRQLTRALDRPALAALPPIARLRRRDSYPLSFSQQTVLSARNAAVYATRFNCPGSFAIDGLVEPERLEAAFQELIRRHEILRTSFDVDRGRQFVHPSVDFRLPVVSCTDAEARQCRAGFVRPFDPTTAPLLRAVLLQSPSGTSDLVFDAHHAVTDAVSMALMTAELWGLYRGEAWRRPAMHYGDYADWQHRLASAGAFQADEAFWRAAIDGFVWTELPAAVAAATPSFDRFVVDVDPAVRDQVQAACERQGLTMAMLLMAALVSTIGQYTGQADVTLGLRVSRRSQAVLERMLGTFVEDASYRVVLPLDRDAETVIARTREALTAVIDHPNHPYDALNADVQRRQPTPNGELFTIMVNHLPAVDLSSAAAGATFVPVARPDTSKYFVNLRLHEGERLTLDAKYRRDKYPEGLIPRLLHDMVDEVRRFSRIETR